MKKKIIAVACAAMLVIGSVIPTVVESKGDETNYKYLDSKGNIDLTGYFDVKGAKKTLTSNSINFELTGSEATVTFNKDLATNGFNVLFNVAGKKDTVEKVEFIATDSEDENKSIILGFGKMNKENVSVNLNNSNRSYMAKGTFVENGKTDINFSYDAEAYSFTDKNMFNIPVTSYMSGEAFSGFKTGKIKLQIKVKGVKGSILSVKMINSQRFTKNNTNDNVTPYICIPQQIKKANYGSIIKTPIAFAMDVLSENSTIKMTVTSPDGKTVKDTDGKELKDVDPSTQYKIKIEQYGSYRLTYKASDGKNTTRNITYQIAIGDNHSPEIALEEEMPETITVGETLNIPNVKITDNSSKENDITKYITVRDPQGRIKNVTDSVKITEAGRYVVTFGAMDESGNVVRQQAVVVAKEK